MKRSLALLTGLVLAFGVLATPASASTPASISAAAPYCGIRWGSLPKSAAGMSAAPLVNVRAGRHACYDRLVLDVAGAANGYSVRYVSQVTADGSGFVVPVRGGARLQLVARVPANNDAGASTYNPTTRSQLVPVAGYRTLRQVAWAGSFEGHTSIGVGVRARLPFRVFVLGGPGSGSRIVIDVAHRW